MFMIHTVVARDLEDNVLNVIPCFDERQVPIAKRKIKQDYPSAVISVIEMEEHPDTPDTAR
jgi:hypothetical protein